jgi:hypothetical protein
MTRAVLGSQFSVAVSSCQFWVLSSQPAKDSLDKLWVLSVSVYLSGGFTEN